MKKHKIGVIGAGMEAVRHVESLRKTGRAEVIHVARKNADALPAFQRKHGIPKGTIDYRVLLADPEVEAVVISTPPFLHREMFEAALAAGKHVILEKPVATSRAEVRAMLAARRARPELIVLECSCRHALLQPRFEQAQEIVASGRLGEVYYVHHNANDRQGRPGIEYHPTAKWFLNRTLAGGGPLMDWGEYDLAFHLGLLGNAPELREVTPLFMRSHLDDMDPGTDTYDVEEHAAVLMHFSGGLRYYWERGNNAHVEVRNETRIYGTRGGLRLASCSWDDPTIERFDLDDAGRARVERIPVAPAADSDEERFAAHVVEVLSGAPPLMPLERAAKHVEIVFEAYEALASL